MSRIIYAIKELEIIKSENWKFQEEYDNYLIYNNESEITEDKNEFKYKHRIHKNSCFWTLEEAKISLAVKIIRKMATLKKTFKSRMLKLDNEYQKLNI